MKWVKNHIFILLIIQKASINDTNIPKNAVNIDIVSDILPILKIFSDKSSDESKTKQNNPKPNDTVKIIKITSIITPPLLSSPLQTIPL